MGYMKIPNLYKDDRIFMFRECYALEKIHGTSAHIRWHYVDGYGWKLQFYSGGAHHENFLKLFNHKELVERFVQMGHRDITVYGEAYGGKLQGMSDTYGNDLKFVVFDILTLNGFLNVVVAHKVAASLGLEFVDYARTDTSIESINYQRDLTSFLAMRNGCGFDKIREGVVLRPVEEYLDQHGNRIITKHKRDEFRETKTPRVVTADKAERMRVANEIAGEWVTPMRILHVVDKLPTKELCVGNMGDIIEGMVFDIQVEAGDEIEMTKDAAKAIGSLTASMVKKMLQERLEKEHAAMPNTQ